MRATAIITLLLLVATTAAAAEGLCPKEAKEGFVSIFNGKDLDGWQGSTKGYVPEDGKLVCEKGGNVFTDKEYADFIFRFEFKNVPGGNNGVGIRTPTNANPAFGGMEIQILDDDHPKYAKLKDYQYHGSIYGVVPAKRGHLKPTGEWNTQEIMAKGGQIKITLNGTVIVDADISKIDKPMDGRGHPGLHNEKGHIGFLGHGARLEFRNLRVKELKE